MHDPAVPKERWRVQTCAPNRAGTMALSLVMRPTTIRLTTRTRPHRSSGTQLSLDLFGVVNRRHVLEAPVNDLVDGVLHHLE